MKRNFVRSARMLIDWDQKDLAEAADIGIATLRDFERGKTVSLNQKNVRKIEEAFKKRGVVFTANGVELVDSLIIEVEGDNWYLDILDDVYRTLRRNPGEFLCMYADDSLSPPAVNNQLREIRNLPDVGMRQLIKEGNEYILGPFSEYRYVSEEFFENCIILLYGNRMAVCVRESKDGVEQKKGLIIREPQINAVMRKNFEFFWVNGSKPEVTNATERF